MVRGDFLIFSSNRSFLLRKRMMEVSVNHLLLQMESNSFKLSCMRFCNGQKMFRLDTGHAGDVETPDHCLLGPH